MDELRTVGQVQARPTTTTGGVRPSLRGLVTRLEQARKLDGVSDRLVKVIAALRRPQVVRDALQGVWLGHPLHPSIVSVPIGSWLSAGVLDAVPGQERAATVLVGTGLAAVPLTAAAGATDWSGLAPEQRRVGLVHATGNVVAAGLYAGSLWARLNSRTTLGRALGYLGLTVGGLSAYLGGHLSYKQAAQVSHAAEWLRLLPAGWQDLGGWAQIPDREPVTRTIGEVPVLVYRRGDDATVMIGHCAHHNGPLHEGERRTVDGADCMVCPWHGSTFRLADGGVVHGPAGVDQTLLRTRVYDGRLQACVP
ncbi:MAG TPA: Rieske 2Fe-2S domain-containing protein [Micromonosporaceae bacterium]